MRFWYFCNASLIICNSVYMWAKKKSFIQQSGRDSDFSWGWTPRKKKCKCLVFIQHIPNHFDNSKDLYNTGFAFIHSHTSGVLYTHGRIRCNLGFSVNVNCRIWEILKLDTDHFHAFTGYKNILCFQFVLDIKHSFNVMQLCYNETRWAYHELMKYLCTCAHVKNSNCYHFSVSDKVAELQPGSPVKRKCMNCFNKNLNCLLQQIQLP